MTGPVHACFQDDTISEVLAAMKQFKIRRMPVVDTHGRLQGVISTNDIVIASAQRRQPAPAEIVSVMAAICAHRPIESAVA
jgi:predicted transcriptional regulator